MYDVIVIGGGPSGLMASIAAAKHGATVLLLEKGDKLGRKLAISGGGRCNVTNRKPIDELIKNIPGNGRFMYSPFAVFNNEDIIRFFENMGIKLKEEDHGRMFPADDDAKTVVNALIKKIKKLGIEIKLNSPVKKLLFNEECVQGVLLKDSTKIFGKNVIIATGGMSIPQTGSTGDAYPWAEEAGHTITELYSTEVPIVSNEPFIKKKTLQGLSLRNIHLSVLNEKGKTIITHEGDLIFTHFGISGPAALRASQFVVKQLKKVPNALLKLDLKPNDSEEQLFQEIRNRLNHDAKKVLKNVLKGFIPDRFLAFLLEELQINGTTSAVNVSHETIRTFVKAVKHFTFSVHGTLPLEKAFVTGGGVSIKEIHPKTMESKKKKGLFFCGEVLDIHGYTGGYNITVAFSTGYTAGKGAAERLNV